MQSPTLFLISGLKQIFTSLIICVCYLRVVGRGVRINFLSKSSVLVSSRSLSVPRHLCFLCIELDSCFSFTFCNTFCSGIFAVSRGRETTPNRST